MEPNSEISIRPYGEADMRVLEKTLGVASQMRYLNGPESPEQIRKRHRKYVEISAKPSAGCMYTIMLGTAAAGNVGFWETEFDGEKVWETGWFVLPEFQRKGIATRAMELMIQEVIKLSRHRYIVAFPSVDNEPSNAIARKLGFVVVRELDLEYPPESGKFLHNNAWRLDLNAR